MLLKRIDLDKVRKEGQRLTDRGAVVQAALTANETNYGVIGPGGYLSPSTIGAWDLCPRAVYYQKFTREVPRYAGLAMIFGQAFHAVMEETFYRYRERQNPVTYEIATDIADDFIRSELEREGALFAEIELKGMTDEEFSKQVQKRTDDLFRTLAVFYQEDWVTKIAPSPDDVVSVERDIMLSVNGIPIYMVLDLELQDKCWDFKYTASSMIDRRIGSLAGDAQLWAQEAVTQKPSGLLLVAPPPKTSRGKPRPLVTMAPRHQPGVRLLPDEDFAEHIEGIVQDINNYRFEARGKTFVGGCNTCAAYDVCTKESCEMPKLDSATSVRRFDYDAASLTEEADDAFELE